MSTTVAEPPEAMRGDLTADETKSLATYALTGKKPA
jgi:hypothetical protein